jgi:hypothetical protein
MIRKTITVVLSDQGRVALHRPGVRLAARRPVLAELVRQAVDAELVALVDQELDFAALVEAE